MTRSRRAIAPLQWDGANGFPKERASFPCLAIYYRVMSELTQVLSAMDAGDPRAANQLLPLIYEELRKLAAVRMANEKSGHTLQPTALVHEAWLKIAGDGNEHFANRRHFFKAAACAMPQSR